jgi:hypothetical protein
MRRSLLPLLLLLALGCETSSPFSDGDTGLEGTVTRSPSRPVCFENDPCEEPLSGDFRVYRMNLVVATFHSAADGSYRVALAPGNYTVRPEPDVPIIDPTSQARMVTVEPGGWTTADLVFDTGIQ